MNRVILAIFILCSLLCLSLQRKPHKIPEKQAIAIAEKFIRDNGYTSVPVDTSSKNLRREFMHDDYRSLTEIIKNRHNRLYSKAFCVHYDSAWSRWNIGFLSQSVEVDKLDSVALNSNLPGESIIIDEKDGSVQVAHKTPLFSRFRKL